MLIAGPSGSGKSTLAGCINGLNPFSNPGECKGTLTVDGVEYVVEAGEGIRYLANKPIFMNVTARRRQKSVWSFIMTNKK